MRKMSSVDPLGGTLLRYAICVALRRLELASVAEVVALIRRWGFTLPENANKAVADAIRWEVRKGRVVKVRRGSYGPGRMPRTTWHRMQYQLLAAQASVSRSDAVPVVLMGSNSLRRGTEEVEDAFDPSSIWVKTKAGRAIDLDALDAYDAGRRRG